MGQPLPTVGRSLKSVWGLPGTPLQSPRKYGPERKKKPRRYDGARIASREIRAAICGVFDPHQTHGRKPCSSTRACAQTRRSRLGGSRRGHRPHWVPGSRRLWARPRRRTSGRTAACWSCCGEPVEVGDHHLLRLMQAPIRKVTALSVCALPRLLKMHFATAGLMPDDDCWA